MTIGLMLDKEAGTAERHRIEAALNSLRVDRKAVPPDGWRGSQTSTAVTAPVAVVRPRQTEEIAAVVQWARRERVPLSTFSSGAGAHERGLTARQPTVLLDLSGLQQILNVDQPDAIAIIEAGVTFGMLEARLAAAGLRTSRTLAPRRNKSVIASMLEREPTLNPHAHWDVLDPFGAGEIVFGSGERFRTGTAAIAGSMTQHLQAGLRYLTAYGPATTDFLRVLQGAQGTLGIVTWSAVMCERVPEVERSFFIAASSPEPLARLLAWVHWRRLGNAVCLVNALQLASLVQRGHDAVEEWAERLPAWAVWLRIGHGGSEFPQEQFDCELAELQAHAASLGLSVQTDLAGLPAEQVAAVQASPPEDVYQDRLRGAHVSVFCLQQLDRVEALVEAAHALLASQDWPRDRVAVYVQPRLQGRNVHIEFTLPHAPGEAARAQQVAAALAEALIAKGGFFSRPYGNWAALAYARNLSLQPYLRQTKQLFDPDRILNPGRLCY